MPVAEKDVLPGPGSSTETETRHVTQDDEGAWPEATPNTETNDGIMAEDPSPEPSSSARPGDDDKKVIPFRPNLPSSAATAVPDKSDTTTEPVPDPTIPPGDQEAFDPGTKADAGAEPAGTDATKDEPLPTPDPTHEQFDQVDDVAAPSDDNTGVILGVLGIAAAFTGLYVATKKGWL